MPTIKVSIFKTPALSSSRYLPKDKLVILDFMATNCISCVKALPRFDSLQKAFGEKIKILLITPEKNEKVNKFLNARRSLGLAMIGEDTLLEKYFPHTFISHEVWIKDGMVKAITGTEYVNARNIKSVLEDKMISWPVKSDIPGFDYTKPILHTNEYVVPSASYPETIYYSAFSGCMKDIPHHYRLQSDSAKGLIRVSLINQPIIDMYAKTYNEEFLPGHILLEVTNRKRYVYDRSMYLAEWKMKNTFCLEALYPLSLPLATLREKMRSELDLFLGLRGRTEFRKVDCLVLICTDTTLLPCSRPTKGEKTFPLSGLIYVLNKSTYGLPVIDETGIKGEIFLPSGPLINPDIPQLQEALKKYGLQLLKGVRETEMLVITETTIH